MDPNKATCAWTRDRLSAFLDGELRAAEHAAVSRHLEACEACRREYAGLAAALSGLKAGLTEAVPEDPQAGELPYGEFVGKLARRARLWPLAVVALGLFWFFLLLELQVYLAPLALHILAGLAAVDVIAFSLLSAPWLPLAARLRGTLRGGGGRGGHLLTSLWISFIWVFGLLSLAFAWVKLFGGPPLMSGLLRLPRSPAAVWGPAMSTCVALAGAAWLGRGRAAPGRVGSLPQFLQGLSVNPVLVAGLIGLAEELFFRGAVQSTFGWPWAVVSFTIEQYLLYERSTGFLMAAAVLALGLGWLTQTGGVLPAAFGHLAFAWLIVGRWRQPDELEGRDNLG